MGGRVSSHIFQQVETTPLPPSYSYPIPEFAGRTVGTASACRCKGPFPDLEEPNLLGSLDPADPTVLSAMEDDGASLGLGDDFAPGRRLRHKLEERGEAVELANELVGTHFKSFLTARDKLDESRGIAEKYAHKMADLQEELGGALADLRVYFEKSLRPVQKKFNVKFPGQGLIREAVQANNARVVGPSCVVGTSVSLEYVDPDKDLPLDEVVGTRR